MQFARLFSKTAKNRNLTSIYKQFREYTMIPEGHYLDNLSLAKSVESINGCIVECGVWRGGMSAGIAKILGQNRTYYLFDSFEGLPPAKEIDGSAAIAWQKDTKSEIYFDNCSAPIEFATTAMNQSGVSRFHSVKGWFNQTLPKYNFSEPIALLRLDGDWYDSTLDCLNYLYKHVVSGGIVVIDDYYTWDGCTRAVHDFLSKNSIPDCIRSTGLTCYIVKK